MNFSIKQLAVVVLIACIAFFLISRYVNDPLRLIDHAGANGGLSLTARQTIDSDAESGFTDDQLEKIINIVPRCESSMFLNLTGTELTDAGFAAFDRASNINLLQLDGLSISDDALRHFHGMIGVRQMAIVDCPNVTDAGLEDLQTALPNLEIIRQRVYWSY